MQAMNRLAQTTNLLMANMVADSTEATTETKTAPSAQIDMSTIRQPVCRCVQLPATLSRARPAARPRQAPTPPRGYA